MTSEAWSAVARLNLFAALAVLTVVALRPAVVGLFGARIRYALWSIVPAAALASLWPAAVKTVTIHAAAGLVATPGVISAQVFGPPPPAAPGLPLSDLLALAWLIGALASLILVARRQRDFLRWASRQGPAVVGLVRPRIHLPRDFEARFNLDERNLILAHERTHLSRQDARVNGLTALVQCLFWFNPAIHLAAWLSRQDQEMACDEAVLARFPGARKTYAEAMLKTLVASAPLPLGCYWPSRARLPLEARIKRLKTRPAGPARRLGGACVIACLASTAGYAAWAVQPPKINTIISGESPASAGLAKAQLGAPQSTLNRARFAKPQGESQSAASDSSQAGEVPHICLTNDCMPRSLASGRDESAVADAVRRLQTGDLIRAGGTPAEVAQVLRALCDQPDQPKCYMIPKPGTEGWGSYTDGSIGLVGSTDPWPIVGALPPQPGSFNRSMIKNSDMDGIPAPETPNRWTYNDPNIKPVTKDVLQPDGTTATVVTGWRLPDGTISKTPPLPPGVPAPSPSSGAQAQPLSLAPSRQAPAITVSQSANITDGASKPVEVATLTRTAHPPKSALPPGRARRPLPALGLLPSGEQHAEVLTGSVLHTVLFYSGRPF
jgi:beta-lactamase regulating signal transducer with metallopeptidase domain